MDTKKENYIAIDIAKYICSVLIIFIHAPAFFYTNNDLYFWIAQIVSRLAVPFFMICSGFLLVNKLDDSKQFFKQIKKLAFTYTGLWVIFLPTVYDKVKLNTMFIRYFFGSMYTHLWYFPAVIWGMLFLYFCKNILKLDDLQVLILSTVLFVVAILFTTYSNVMPRTAIVYNINRIFFNKLFLIFIACFFISAGYMVKKYIHNINLKSYIVLSAIIFIIYNIESYYIKKHIKLYFIDFTFTTSLMVVVSLIVISNIKIDIKYENTGLFLRKMSTELYYYHPLVNTIVIKYMSNIIPLYTIVHFMVVLVVTSVIAIIIIKINDKRHLQKQMSLSFI